MNSPARPPVYWADHAPIALVALVAVVGLGFIFLQPSAQTYAGFAFAGNNTSNNSDLIRPVVSILTPTQYSTLSSTATITASASDNIGVSFVEFYAIRVASPAMYAIGTDASAPYSVDWSTATVPDGLYNLTATAYDANWNWGSDSVLVYVNNTPTAVCGNYLAEVGEQCDRNDLRGATCVGLGFSGGTLLCSSSCWFDTQYCVNSSTQTYYLHDAFDIDDGTGKLTEFFFRSVDPLSNTLTFQEITSGTQLTTTYTGSQFILLHRGVSYFGTYDQNTQSIRFPNHVTTPWEMGEGFGIGDTFPLNEWSGRVSYVTSLAINPSQQTLDFLVGTTPVTVSYSTRADGNGMFDFVIGGYAYAGRIVANSDFDLERGDDLLPPPVFANITAPLVGTKLPAGTTSTVLQVTTNKPALCRYATSDIAYSSMTGILSTSYATAHSGTLSGLVNGVSYTYYVRCANVIGTPMTYSVSTTFSVAAPTDTTPPVISGGSPTGTVATTKSVTMRAATNEAANCRHGDATTAFTSMSKFSTTGGTSHSTTLTVAPGKSYTRYVKCQDSAGNINTVSYPVSFSVAPDTVAPSVAINNPKNNANVTGTISLSATASDNVGVVGVQFFVDNIASGSEDTSSPYSSSWNTKLAGRGYHVLTARARDAAGNTKLSAPITVYVP